ncbi:MAG: Rrf2 family transcriptional regulator [Methylocystaceae bacterium]|nr:MAG: Rrf2 family transcriptional regulator [Methylocystaceae bacterium]
MRLTLHSDLAFRTLIFLAAAGKEGGAIPQIAETYGVSENHLRKVVNHLAQAGWVESTRGRGGGLRLRPAPAEISIGAVMREMEADFALVDCLGAEPERCVISGFCGLQRIFGEALQAWFQVLDRYTLADAMDGSRGLPKLLGLDEPARASKGS